MTEPLTPCNMHCTIAVTDCDVLLLSEPDDLFMSGERIPRIPHHVSVLRIPAKRYMTVSRSGEIWLPEIQMSSAVFTTTDISLLSITFCMPCRSFGVPVPPERNVIITQYFYAMYMKIL